MGEGHAYRNRKLSYTLLSYTQLYSTGYFPLERGGRQGDPLAQYLFIVAIEILATLVTNNNNIKGIPIHGKQVQLGVFADDTAFFLHDTASLGEVLKVLKVFFGYSYMNVNYEKSEITWIGSWRKREDNPYPFNWINLTKESIMILGIFFSFCDDITNKMNFVRWQENLKNILKLWSSRNLTIYGRIEVCKTLALSKVLYVCNMLDPPLGFIDNIKSIIRSFVWNNRKPKLKYNTIICDYFQGGLKVPDLYCRIKTQGIMWVKRIITQLQGPATELLNLKLKYLGGLDCIGSNFDIKQIPNTIPDFYITCLKTWADFTASKPDNYKEIIEQPVWNNRYKNINDKSIYYEDIRNLGVIYMKDIIKADGEIKQIEDFNIPPNQIIASYFLKWASLRDAIPKSWKRILKEYASNKNIELSGTKALYCRKW